jgi:hypothetical protein
LVFLEGIYGCYYIIFSLTLKGMKITRLEKFYVAVLVVIFGGIVLHAPLTVGLGVLFPDFSLLIKSWKEILMLIAAVVGAVIVTRRRVWSELWNDWTLRIIALFTVLHLVLTFISYKGLEATLAGLAIDLRYVAFFVLVYIAIKLFPQYRKLMVIVAIIGAFIVVCFATIQFFLPPDILSHIGYSKETIAPYLTVDKNPDYIRVNSTLRGPNPLGAYAGMVLGLIAAAFVRAKLDFKNRKVVIGTVILTVCSLTALWLSYSRSALVAGIITVATVFVASVMRKFSRRAWIISCAVIFAIVGGLAVGRDTGFVQNVILHENPNGGSAISSNEGHVESLQYGTAQLLREPLGSGVGSTGSASLFTNKPVVVENQYLFIAHEAGWLGLLLFLALYGIILVRLWRYKQDWLALGMFASGIGLGLVGLLLPVWVDDTVSIIWWGLAAIALAGGGYARKKTK